MPVRFVITSARIWHEGSAVSRCATKAGAPFITGFGMSGIRHFNAESYGN